MPERREGLDPDRAEYLERVLNGLFEGAIAGSLGRKDEDLGLSMLDIIEKRVEETRRLTKLEQTPFDALMGYLDARAVDSFYKTQIALVFGELYGAGDVSKIEERLRWGGFMLERANS